MRKRSFRLRFLDEMDYLFLSWVRFVRCKRRKQKKTKTKKKKKKEEEEVKLLN